jgi:hypothetical protein
MAVRPLAGVSVRWQWFVGDVTLAAITAQVRAHSRRQDTALQERVEQTRHSRLTGLPVKATKASRFAKGTFPISRTAAASNAGTGQWVRTSRSKRNSDGDTHGRAQSEAVPRLTSPSMQGSGAAQALQRLPQDRL